MERFYGTHYQLTMTLLSVSGFRPTQNVHYARFATYVSCLFLYSCIFFQASKFIQVYNKDIETVLNIIPTIFMIMGASINIPIINTKRNKFSLLIELMKADWESQTIKEEIEIKDIYTKEARRITLFIALYFIGLGAPCFIVTEYVRGFILNKSDNYEPVVPIEFFINPHKYRYLIFTYISLIVLVLIVQLTAHTMISIVFLYHVCGMFAVVGYRLENVINGQNFLTIEKSSDNSENYSEYRNIVFCIQAHRKAIQFVLVMESFYSLSLFIILGFSIVILSFALVQVLDAKSINVAAAVIAVGQFLFFVESCEMGQKLIDSSSIVYEKVYNNNWYNCSINVQKLLIIILARSRKPCVLTAYKFYVLSLEHLRKALQTVFSFFMAIQQLR